MIAGPLRRLAKQPFDDGAQTNKSGKEQQRLGPAVFTQVLSDEVVTSLVLFRQIGDRAGESNDMLADCCQTGIKDLRNWLFDSLRGGFGFSLLFEPIAHLRIGEQSRQLLDLFRRRLLARWS